MSGGGRDAGEAAGGGSWPSLPLQLGHGHGVLASARRGPLKALLPRVAEHTTRGRDAAAKRGAEPAFCLQLGDRLRPNVSSSAETIRTPTGVSEGRKEGCNHCKPWNSLPQEVGWPRAWRASKKRGNAHRCFRESMELPCTGAVYPQMGNSSSSRKSLWPHALLLGFPDTWAPKEGKRLSNGYLAWVRRGPGSSPAPRKKSMSCKLLSIGTDNDARRGPRLHLPATQWGSLAFSRRHGSDRQPLCPRTLRLNGPRESLHPSWCKAGRASLGKACQR